MKHYKLNAQKYAASMGMNGIPPCIRKMHGHPATFGSGEEKGICGLLEVYRDCCDEV